MLEDGSIIFKYLYDDYLYIIVSKDIEIGKFILDGYYDYFYVKDKVGMVILK